NFFSTAKSNAISFGSRSTTLENFTFINFYWQPVSSTSGNDGEFIYSSSGPVIFKNCTFSGQIESIKGKKHFFYSSSLRFNESSLNIIVNSAENFTLFKGDINNSDIIFDITAPTVTIADGSARNSRFSGKISSENTVSLCDDGSGYNVYNIITSSLLSYVSKGISVYNSDISTSSQSDEDMESLGIKFKGCTAEQLKNPTYLYNLRFPIGVD
ncbi:MAG: hypothetical protein K2J08_07860, partial [Ruminococcus sp.]|nr:hypothetical protein [Ruminococcus sp.]